MLDDRNSDASVIEGRFVEQVLRDQAASILTDSRREMRGFSQAKWRNVKMTVDKNTLNYQHLAVHRFIDMKTRKASNYKASTRKMKGGRQKKGNYPIHNKVIFQHKRFIIKRLSFGFTDEVKAQFRKLVADENKVV